MEVSGGATLRRTLREAGVDLADLKEAHARVAEVVRAAAAANAPVLTGRLRNTIKGRGNRTAAVVKAGTPKSVPYAGVIHYGWPARNIAANPFLQRAVDAHRDRYLAMYLNELETILDRVKGAPGP